jgi:hypothetical protein
MWVRSVKTALGLPQQFGCFLTVLSPDLSRLNSGLISIEIVYRVPALTLGRGVTTA